MLHLFVITGSIRIIWELHQIRSKIIHPTLAVQTMGNALHITPSFPFMIQSMTPTGTWIVVQVTTLITNNPSNLNSTEKYVGKDNLTVGNGKEVKISHVSTSVMQLPSKTLKPQNIIYSPHIKKNLLSVSILTSQKFCNSWMWLTFLLWRTRLQRRQSFRGNLRMDCISSPTLSYTLMQHPHNRIP